MNLPQRIKAFVELGNRIKAISDEEFTFLIKNAKANNSWFTDQTIKSALEGIADYLNEKDLTEWISSYDLSKINPKKIGVVMAGNIPLVGFHDFLTVLVSGHHLYAKLSPQDSFLISKLADWLIEIEPGFKEKIQFPEKINNMDAVIATGSDNTAKYFHYYFSKIPHIIRKNRVSCAVLDGHENQEDLQKLGKDIFLYFGLGCRNVAKLYVPTGYSFQNFFDNQEIYKPWIDLNKYYHNYDYNKSIFLLDLTPHFDNGFLMLKEDKGIASPISVIFYEYYSNVDELDKMIENHRDKIQVIVSKKKWYKGSIDIGEAQSPKVWDYADKVDTVKFLMEV